MGFLKDLLGAAAPIAGSFFGPVGAAIGGAAGSFMSGKDQAKAAQNAANTPWTSNQTQTTTLDPRVSSALFGAGPGEGLFGQIQSAINQPRTAGSTALGGAADQFLGQNAQQILANQYAANNALQRGYTEPAMQAAQARAAQVSAPSQNELNLSPAYQNMIYGNSAENPYLTSALNASSDQSRQAFNTLQGDIAHNLKESILPGIRGNAIASGQYGGSRQGIAEGLALGRANRQAQDAAQQIGLADIAARTGAQSGAFESGQNRALSAMQGLGGQQYGTAIQNAQFQQQTELANAAARQAADMANIQALMGTRGLNSSNLQAGIQGTQNLLGAAGNIANQNDQYSLNRAAQGTGLLSPFLNVGSTQTSTGSGTGQPQPIYQNQGANILGGAAAGLGLFNQISGLFGNKTPAQTGNVGSGIASMFPNGY